MESVHPSVTGKKVAVEKSPAESARERQQRTRSVPFRERVTCSVDDGSEATGWSKSELYKAMADRRLRYVRHGRRRLLVVPSLIALVNGTPDSDTGVA